MTCPLCNTEMLGVTQGDGSNVPTPLEDIHNWQEYGCFGCNAMHLRVTLVPRYKVDEITIEWEVTPPEGDAC